MPQARQLMIYQTPDAKFANLLAVVAQSKQLEAVAGACKYDRTTWAIPLWQIEVKATPHEFSDVLIAAILRYAQKKRPQDCHLVSAQQQKQLL